MCFWCGCDVWGKILKNYDVSIIVPIYNVEKFIAKCVTTLMEQDYKNIEYIFVNDCTPDNSMQVLSDTLAKYPNRKDDIKIINKSKNEGLGQARKTGFENANGEYILHIDSDDWVELNMVSSMLKKAKETDADIVVSDFFITYVDKEIYKKQNYKNIEQKDMLKSLLLDIVMPCIWNKFYRKELFQSIQFPNFQMGEDMFLNTQLFYNAKKIVYLNQAFLHYNQMNLSSITAKISEKTIGDLIKLNISIEKFLKRKNIFDELKEFHYTRMCFIITRISFGKTNKLFNSICPQSYKIKYIIRNKNLGFLKKLIYALKFYNFNVIFNMCKKIYLIVK